MNVKEIFANENIEYVSALDIKADDIRRADLISRRGVDPEKIKTAIVFLIPYFASDERGNISLYARPRDYHAYADGLFSRIVPKLKERYGGEFLAFADKSPIEETNAALRAGLCVRGDSYVVINEKYGSFVFIGEVLTTHAAADLDMDGAPRDIGECLHCGACRRACPMKNGRECLSAVTQKKGELSEDEKNYILENGYAWGCDICQISCPMNKNITETPIEYFKKERMAFLTSKQIEDMNDDEFLTRAFSWRGKKTLVRNLKLFEENSK